MGAGKQQQVETHFVLRLLIMMIITRNRRYMCYMQRHRRSVPPPPLPPFLRPCLLMKYETLLCGCPTADHELGTPVYILLLHISNAPH